MVVKELRQGLRHTFFVWPFILLHFGVLCFLAVEWRMAAANVGTGSVSYANTLSESMFWAAILLVVGVLMPLRSFGALESEQDKGNNELLVLSGLSRWQIIRGKCRVQMALNLLSILSLTPYFIVRYFLGSFDFMLNVGMFITLLVFSNSLTGLIVGISGFQTLGKRITMLVVGGFYLIILLASAVGVVASLTQQFSGKWILIYSLICIYLTMMFYGVLGQQIGRAKLKLFLRPWEVPPSNTMVALFIMSPALLALGVAMTLGVGAILPILGMYLCVLFYDRQVILPQPPAVSK